MIFPPGRAKLLISPVATGSSVVTITMGIVLVACLAARIPGVCVATSTSTLSCTSSATRLGIRSRDSLNSSDTQPGCFSPQYNRDLLDPCRNASTDGPGLLVPLPDTNPIRGILALLRPADGQSAKSMAQSAEAMKTFLMSLLQRFYCSPLTIIS